MLHIITLGSNEDEMKYLKESAQRNGVTIKFIFCDKWNGYIDKITTMKETIKDNLPAVEEENIERFVDKRFNHL
jgi:dTDP-glucose pyrophosphorylase